MGLQSRGIWDLDGWTIVLLGLRHTEEWRCNSDIMRPILFHAEDLRSVLRKQKIATMSELKAALGTDVDVTVFRKLHELSYRTSYSHRGSYYTLDEIVHFDTQDLWSCRSVWFSRYGTLLSTVESFVKQSTSGCFARELEAHLHVGVKEALLKLVRDGRIAREEVSGLFLYSSPDRARRKHQLLARQVEAVAPSLTRSVVAGRILPDEVKAAIVLFASLLDEKQRRLYAALESLKFGHGGDRRIAALLGLDVGTVARGRHELLAQDFELERVRKPGAGRRPVEKKRRQ